MSFSARAKREMCRVPIEKPCCAAAECYGALLLGNTFRTDELRIVTSHEEYAERLAELFMRAFSVRFNDMPPQMRKHTLAVTNPADISKIRAAFGYGTQPGVALHLNNAVLEHECCLSAFWRGAFMSGGSVTNPDKKYRLEIVTPHRHLARELAALLGESGLEARTGERAGTQVLYFKKSESIEDFLTLTGAPVASLTIMEAKVEKDMRNRVNRRVNCDNANLDKTLAAVERQKAAITGLSLSGRIDGLPDSLRALARARLENPEDSLSQLAALLGVSRSCVNHRMRKLCELARQK